MRRVVSDGPQGSPAHKLRCAESLPPLSLRRKSPALETDRVCASKVLPLANSPGGHRLGVNGLAVDSDRSILSVRSPPQAPQMLTQGQLLRRT